MSKLQHSPRHVDAQIEWLEQKHSSLHQKVAALDSRAHLSTVEETEMRRLKKEKLRTKDELARARDSAAH